jgi:hypothetical protein
MTDMSVVSHIFEYSLSEIARAREHRHNAQTYKDFLEVSDMYPNIHSVDKLYIYNTCPTIYEQIFGFVSRQISKHQKSKACRIHVCIEQCVCVGKSYIKITWNNTSWKFQSA